MKTCSKCKRRKRLNAFYRDSSGEGGLGQICKPCVREKNRQYYLSHKGDISKRVSRWRSRNPQKVQEYKRRTKYGLLPGQYSQLLESQGGCGICGLYPGGLDKNGKALCIDHDHVTGCVRGLLCTRCNTGRFYNDIELMQRSIIYHNDPPARRILEIK